MGFTTALMIGLAATGGAIAGAKLAGRNKQQSNTGDPAVVEAVKANEARQPAPAATPVEAPKAQSKATETATTVAQRTRRRAAAGAAGKVTTPGQHMGATGYVQPRTLIGLGG